MGCRPDCCGPALHRDKHTYASKSAESDEEGADRSGQEKGPVPELLRKDHDRDPAHPEEAHRPGDEEDEHEEPAASDAIQGVAKAHADCADSAGPPRAHYERQRRRAIPTAESFRPPYLPAAVRQR